MSGYETHELNPGTAVNETGSASPGRWHGRFRHSGMALLPLGLFVGGVLVYEQAGQEAAPPQSQAVAASPTPTASPTPAPRATTAEVPAATSNAAKPVVVAPFQTAERGEYVTPAAAPATAPQLVDNRSLLDLTHNSERVQPPLPPGTTQRQITLQPGPTARASLGFVRAEPLPAGAYATIRGVPVDARLTHGLSVGNETWLVDGAELSLVGLEMRSGGAGAIDLNLQVLSADNRQIASERIAIAIKAAANEASVSPAVATVPAASKAPAEQAPRAIAKPTLKLVTDTQLAPGRGNVMKFEVSPAGELPEGFYMLLHGLPRDSTLSRGVPVGPDVWLLTASELQSFEVRLPARAAGAILLEAKLVTRLGELLAQTTASLDAGVRPSAIPAIAQAATPSVAPSASAAIVARSVPPASALPTPKSKAALAEDKVAGNSALFRGRQMLALGNIAIARPLLERAALEGSGEAAALLGASFDPNWLQRAGVLGIAGDSAAARSWYDEARRLGTGDIEKVVSLVTTRGASSVPR